MPHSTKLPAHTFDYAPIICTCGKMLGYRYARTTEPLRCVACDAEWSGKPPSADPYPPEVRALLSALESAIAVAKAGDHSVVIGRDEWTAVVEAKGLVKV